METVIREKVIPVKGTTKLRIGDPYYFEAIRNKTTRGAEKEMVFDGSISAAPLGKIKIALVHVKEADIEFDSLEVTVVQGLREEMLDVYLDNKYYKDTKVKEVELGCDTACFELETKYSYDKFDTGADGWYGHFDKYKQYFGSTLSLSFATDLFTFEEIEKRMLKLFPERKAA